MIFTRKWLIDFFSNNCSTKDKALSASRWSPCWGLFLSSEGVWVPTIKLSQLIPILILQSSSIMRGVGHSANKSANNLNYCYYFVFGSSKMLKIMPSVKMNQWCIIFTENTESFDQNWLVEASWKSGLAAYQEISPALKKIHRQAGEAWIV